MAHNYISVDRDQLYLLPPDMGQWLPEDHLAWFVIDVVEKIDTSILHKKHPNTGVGRPAYNPDMMLALLIYAYCTKVRSSRDIERLCRSDVAYRVLCADEIPDHSTISRFRVDFQDLAKKLFCDVLALAKEAGADSVGVVAIDGTKMAGNASLKKNRTRLDIENQVAQMFAEAEKVDEEENGLYGNKRGDELPLELTERATRKQALDRALRALDEREAEEPTARQLRDRDDRIRSSRQREYRSLKRLRKELAIARNRRKRQQEQLAKGHKPSGKPLKDGHTEPTHVRKARSDYEANKARRKEFEKRSGKEQSSEPKVNLTDPQSRIMHTAQGTWIQGYNAQAAVNEDGIVVGSFVCGEPNDLNQFVPMITNIADNLAQSGIENEIGVVIADAGYHSENNLNAKGPDRLIANSKAWKLKQKTPSNEPLPEGATPTETNSHRLSTKEGRSIYSKRQHMIESVFGHTKANKGFRQFLQRGIKAVSAEWDLMMTAHNIEKLYSRGK